MISIQLDKGISRFGLSNRGRVRKGETHSVQPLRHRSEAGMRISPTIRPNPQAHSGATDRSWHPSCTMPPHLLASSNKAERMIRQQRTRQALRTSFIGCPVTFDGPPEDFALPMPTGTTSTQRRRNQASEARGTCNRNHKSGVLPLSLSHAKSFHNAALHRPSSSKAKDPRAQQTQHESPRSRDACCCSWRQPLYHRFGAAALHVKRMKRSAAP
jgi:hypothetical protein